MSEITDAMVDAYLTEQRRTVEETDQFILNRIGALPTNTVRAATRNGLAAALAAAPAQSVGQDENIELRRLHAENETLRTGYDAARLEIESLKAQLKEHADELAVAYLCGASREKELAVQLVEAPLMGAAGDAGWLPIETAPTGANGYVWMHLAWGPENDQSTGSGMRFGDKFFAAATFYQLGQEQQYAMRVIEVEPTHWMKLPEAPNA